MTRKLLVDSSVWINLLKENYTVASLFFQQNFDNYIIVTCPTIIQEVLQGIRSDQSFQEIKSYFDNIFQLNNDPYLMAIKAAQLYRNLRKTGVTIRKPNDCLIAVYAIENGIQLLQDDKDFGFIASNSELKLI